LPVPETTWQWPRGLDHFVLAVHDLEAAQLRFQQLGFTTTPRARHPWGTENILVQLQDCFIEILAIAPGHVMEPPIPGHFSFGFFNQEFLRENEGLSMQVFSSSDAQADRQHWCEQELSGYAPFNFSRMATLEDGRQVPVAFSLAFVSHLEMPHAAWFVCQQHHPENFWKAAFQQHENGASGVAAVTLAAQTPQRYGHFLASLFPEGQVRSSQPQALELQLPRGQVQVRSAALLETSMPGISARVSRHGPLWALLEVKVRELQRVRDVLSKNHFPHTVAAAGLMILPDDLFGMGLLFTD